MATFGEAKNADDGIREEDWKLLQESSSNLNFGRRKSRIRMSFKSIQAEAQRLSSKTTKQNVSSTQIKDFAAKAGVNIQDQQQYIASLAAASSNRADLTSSTGRTSVFGMADEFRTGAGKMKYPTNTLEVRNFLKEHHSFIVSSTIRECQEQSAIKFRKNYESSMEEEWDCDKRDILKFLEQRMSGLQNVQQPQQSMMNQSLLAYPEFIDNHP